MLFRIFHRQSSVEALANSRELIEEMPPSFKEYTRFPQFSLPHPQLPSGSYKSLLRNRVSERNFDTKKSLELEDISEILFTGAGLNDGRLDAPTKEPRHHPSGGALYPLECYIAAFRVRSLPVGIYHYAPKSHALEHLVSAQKPAIVLEACKDLIPSENPAIVLMITGVWGRSYPKYGELAYRLALLEAGHMMQNMLLAATSREIKSCPLVGFRIQMIAEALDISEEIEDPLYLAFLGR